MQASLTLAAGADGADDAYNGMTITTGGDVVAVGVITDYDGTAKTFTATWSACAETGAVCDDGDGVTPTMTAATTYVISQCAAADTAACAADREVAADRRMRRARWQRRDARRR